MKYYGCHWTSDDGTELQIRLELLSLQLWARSCPKGGEWEAWRRLDVLRDANGALQETALKALKADSADFAARAATADLASRAQKADEANFANSAARADQAANADHASHADKADNADHAQNADAAKKLAKPVTINITGAVTGSGTLDGSGPVTIPTQGGDAFKQLQAEINSLKSWLDGLSGAINGANAANGALGQKLAALEKRVGMLEADDSGAITAELLSWRTNELWSDMNDIRAHVFNDENASGRIERPVWWGDRYMPDSHTNPTA